MRTGMSEQQKQQSRLDKDKPHMTHEGQLDMRVYGTDLFGNGLKLAEAHLKGPKAFREACAEIRRNSSAPPAPPR
jgi:hypothetical protein